MLELWCLLKGHLLGHLSGVCLSRFGLHLSHMDSLQFFIRWVPMLAGHYV